MQGETRRVTKSASPKADEGCGLGDNPSGQCLLPPPYEAQKAMRIGPGRHERSQLLPINVASLRRFLALCLASIAASWLFQLQGPVGTSSNTTSHAEVQLALKRFEESLQ